MPNRHGLGRGLGALLSSSSEAGTSSMELPVGDDTPAAPVTGGPIDTSVPFVEARRRALVDFERRYLEALIAQHKGKIVQAANAADIDRVYLYKLLKRHGIQK